MHKPFIHESHKEMIHEERQGAQVITEQVAPIIKEEFVRAPIIEKEVAQVAVIEETNVVGEKVSGVVAAAPETLEEVDIIHKN